MDISKGAEHLDLAQFNSLLERLQQTWIEQQVSKSQVVKSLQENCRKLNLAFHGRTPTDGNCFFHAISDQLNLLGLPHQSPWELRQSVVQFLQRNPSIQVQDGAIDFQAIHPDWDRYCNSMARDREWADHVVITATAYLLQRDIVIVTSSPQGADSAEPFIRISCNQASSPNQPFLLGHVWELHYQSLKQIGKDVQSPDAASHVAMMPSSYLHSESPSPMSTDELQLSESLTVTGHVRLQGKDVQSPDAASPVGMMSSSYLHPKSPSPMSTDELQLSESLTVIGHVRLQDEASDADFDHVIRHLDLDSDDLHNLFYQLKISHTKIENAQRIADSNDVNLRARFVLLTWRQMNGKEATRQALLDALGRCGYIEAKEIMQDIWSGKDVKKTPVSKLYEIIEPLGSEELSRLYQALCLKSTDVERAEQRVQSSDIHQRARSVIRWWKKTNGKKATCQALLKTLESCRITQTPTQAMKDFEEEVIKWRRRLMKKYSLDRRKIRFGKSTRAVADTDDIFVDLVLRKCKEEKSRAKEKEHVHDMFSGFQYESSSKMRADDIKLESHEDLLSLKDEEGGDTNHVLLYGPAGSGKTTLISRMAYTWATQASRSSGATHTQTKRTKLNWSGFELVFVLDIRRFKSEACLEQVIQKQLLPGVALESIANIMSELGPKCLIMFDGYDEKQQDVDDEIMNSPLLSECFVIVTMRPHVLGEFCCNLGKSEYVRVEVFGFSPENVNKYVHNFFKKTKNPERADILIQKLQTTPVFKALSLFPILLVMMCLLWEDSQRPDIPYKTVTGLYQQAVMYLNKPFLQTHRGVNRKTIDDVLIKLGEPAFEALLTNTVQISADKFKDQEVLEQSFEIGLTSCEEGDLIDERYVTFIHKTFQEFCAAKYLTNLAETDYAAFTIHLSDIFPELFEYVYDLPYILRFCCGLNISAGKAIVSHVSSKWPSMWTHILRLMYEAETCCKAKDTSWLNSHFHVEGGSLNLNRYNGLQCSEVVSAFFYFINAELSGKHLWLKGICDFNFEENNGKLSLRTLLKALQCMTSIETMSLSRITIVNEDGDGLILCRLGHIDIVRISNIVVDIQNIFNLVSCFQSVDIVSLHEVNLTGKSSKRPSHEYPSVRKLQVGNEMSGSKLFDVNTNSLVSFLKCLPCLEDISLQSLRMSGSLEYLISVPQLGYKNILMNYVTISACLFECFFQCNNSTLDTVLLGNVIITGIHPQLSLTCGRVRYENTLLRPLLDEKYDSPSKLLKLSSVSSSPRFDDKPPDIIIVPARNLSFIPSTYFEEISLSNIALVKDMSTIVTEQCNSCGSTHCTKSNQEFPTTEYDKQPTRKLTIKGPFNHFLTLSALNTVISVLRSVESVHLSEVNLADDLDERSPILWQSVKSLQIDTFSLKPLALIGDDDRLMLSKYASKRSSNQHRNPLSFGSCFAHKENSKLELPPVEINALMRFLHCMPALRTVKLEGIAEISGELKESCQKSLQFLNEFALLSEASYTVDIAGHTMLRLLGCMPSVRTVSLRNVVWKDEVCVSDRVEPACLTLKKFIMSAGSLSIVTLLNTLHLMPSVEIVELSHIHLTKKLANVSIPNSDHHICKVEAHTVIRLLHHMPSLRSIRCRNVEITGVFQLSGSVDLKSLVILLEGLPSTTKVKLDEIKMKDDDLGDDIGRRVIAISDLSVCGAFNQFDQDRFKCRINASSMIMFLGCMASVITLKLDKVELIEDIAPIATVKCTSLKHFQVGGSLSGDTLVKLLGCMPAVERVDLLNVDITGEVMGTLSPLCKLSNLTWTGSSSVETLKKLLSCLPSAKPFRLAKVKVSKMRGNTDYMSSSALKDKLKLAGTSVDSRNVMRLLDFMPIASEVQLENVIFNGDIDTEISPSRKLWELQIRNSIGNTTLLTSVLHYMEADRVSFDILGLPSVDEHETCSGSTIKCFTMSGSLSADTLVGMLGCLSSITHIVLDPVRLTSEVSSNLLSVCKYVENVCIAGWWEENTLVRIIHCLPYSTHVRIVFPPSESRLMAESMLTILAGLPLVSSIQIDNLNLQGDIDISTSHRKFEMLKLLQMSGRGSSDILVKLLHYMPSLETLGLIGMKVEEATGQIEPCKSLKTLVVKKGNVSPSVLMQLVCCMPSLAEVHIDLPSSISINMLAQLLGKLFVISRMILKFSRVEGGLETRLLTSCKSLKILTLTCNRWITNGNTLLRFLGCMPSAIAMTLKGSYMIVGDVTKDCISPVFKDLTDFTISGSLYISTLYKLLSCMPSLRQVTLNVHSLAGEAGNKDTICNKVDKLVILPETNHVLGTVNYCTVDIATMVGLLKCMPLTTLVINGGVIGKLTLNHRPSLKSIKDLKENH